MNQFSSKGTYFLYNLYCNKNCCFFLPSGSGGRLANKGGTLSQYVVQQLVVQKEDPYEDNPREAILRHAKVAEENPLYVAPAYNKYVFNYNVRHLMVCDIV